MDLHPNLYTWLTAAGSAALSVLALRGPAVHTLFARKIEPELPTRNHFIHNNEIIDEIMACAQPHFFVATFHGGPAVRSAVDAALAQSGFQPADIQPFGRTRLERETLALLHQAKGPAAVGLVLDAARHEADLRALVADPDAIPALLAQSAACRYLFNRPRVQLWGPVNAGKSSLLNALCGRNIAATGPEPGLTRDVIEGLVEHRGFELQVFDAPGQWAATGPLDQAALALAARWRDQADLTIVLVPPGDAPGQEAPGTWLLPSRVDESGLTGVSTRVAATVDALKDRLVEHFFGPLTALAPHRRFALHPQLRQDLTDGRGREWLTDSGR